MTDYRTSDQDVNRVIRSWLHEDRHEDVSRVAGAVLDQVEATPQRRTTWWPARRTPIVNKILGFGLAAAAVVAVALIGTQILNSSGGFGAGPTLSPEPTTTPEPSLAEPSPSAAAGLPVGSTVELYNEALLIQATIPAPGWEHDEFGPTKSAGGEGDGGAWVVGTWSGPKSIPSDPCHWASTLPDAPATTLDETVAALASQTTRDASESVDVTVDGHPGKVITLHVPADLAYSAADGFTDCDEGKFCTTASEGACDMFYMAPDEFQQIWIVDVDGELYYETGNYYPGTPPDVVEELQAILGSMTFGE